MRKMIALVAVAMLMAPAAWAVSQRTLNVSCSVGDVLELTVDVRERDAAGNITGGNLSPNMNFGELVRDGNNAMRGSKDFAVYLSANSASRPYQVKATMGQLSNGAVQLPEAVVAVVTHATDAGNNDIPGDTLDTTPKNAKMTNQTVYGSNVAGDSATVEMIYGISGGNPDGSAPFVGWQAVPPDQATGSYSGTVTYDLVLT